MKKNSLKKLALTTETVRSLNDEDMTTAIGGVVVLPSAVCTTNCTAFRCGPITTSTHTV